MITSQEVVPLLLAVCPSIEPRWMQHCDYWGSDRTLYLDLGVIARHCVELLRQGSVEEFADVFGVCERLHLEGDPVVREAATIGLLENIQNIALNTGGESLLEEFRRFLLPESLVWWDRLIGFWSGAAPAVGPDEPPRSTA